MVKVIYFYEKSVIEKVFGYYSFRDGYFYLGYWLVVSIYRNNNELFISRVLVWICWIW